MAQYQADVWLGSASGRQRVYVNSNTWNGAREQIKTIYHVSDGDIWNLCESRQNNSIGGSNSVDFGSIVALGAVVFVIYFWKYLLAIGIICAIIWAIHYFNNK
jgi:hypothetical protein